MFRRGGAEAPFRRLPGCHRPPPGMLPPPPGVHPDHLAVGAIYGCAVLQLVDFLKLF